MSVIFKLVRHPELLQEPELECGGPLFEVPANTCAKHEKKSMFKNIEMLRGVKFLAGV